LLKGDCQLITLGFEEQMKRTSLSNSGAINDRIGPASSLDALVPIVLHGCTLWEDNGSVNGTGDRIECDEAPKEDFPLLACQAK
jgi:hypothetical protein